MGQCAVALIRALGLFTAVEDVANTNSTLDPDYAEERDSLCVTCSGLDLHGYFYDGLPRERAVLLGSIADVFEKSESCNFCSLVSLIVRRGWLLDKKPYSFDPSAIRLSLYAMDCGCLSDPVPPTRQLAHRLYILPSERPLEVYAAVTAAQAGLMLNIQLMEDDAEKMARTRALHGRRVPEMVNLDLVRRWMNLCHEAHGEVCASAWWRGSDETLLDTVRMVDVLENRIVIAPADVRYIALSYLWGGTGESYWTTKDNLPSRMRPAGLPPSALPTTISDAILLTRELGERYLWVDALCIAQDDPTDKAVQIGVMELIYGSAALTIFAAGGTSANAPLPGLRSGTRTVHQHIETVKGLNLTVPLPILSEALATTAWDTRGWTYQELMLSRRRLFFTQEQVYFECGLDVWAEDLVAEGPRIPRGYQPLRNNGRGGFTYLRAPASQLPEWWMMNYTLAVSQYTHRRLSVETDIVDAISALTNAIAKGFKLGDPVKAFPMGMAVVLLDEALLWQPDSYCTHERRILRDESSFGASRCPWPSWTWAGWRGAVRYSSNGQFVSIHRTSDAPRVTESLVDRWFIVSKERTLVPLDVRPIERIVVHRKAVENSIQYNPPHWDTSFVARREQLESGTLVFRTTFARFTVNMLASDNDGSRTTVAGEHYGLYTILSTPDSTPWNVGRIILPKSHPSPPIMDFIVLSRTNPGGLQGVYDVESYGEPYSGCFLYVMAVSRIDNSEMMERRGVGIIHEKAWLEARSIEKVAMLL